MIAAPGSGRLALQLSLWVGLASPLGAFHEEGVANCNGCHITHTGDGGAVVAQGLLIAESASDVCLLCHEGNWGRVLGSDPRSPPPQHGAGNFAFLLEGNLNDTPEGVGGPIPGDAAGHNIVAPGHALGADPRYPVAPGGGFPSNRLGCTSCHDPHGTGNFRLLHGAGEIHEGVATFRFSAPDAVGVGLKSGGESARHHTAYRAGMSDWCGNCHGRYHDQGVSGFEHPSEENLDATVAQRYNEYNGDDDPTGGVEVTAYLPEVPLEDAAATTSSTSGARVSSRIMCLTCHRAHGSSAPAAGRWDFNVPFLADDGRESGSYAIPSPYLDLNQGSLCAKCHDGPAASPLQVPDPGLFTEPPTWPTDPDGKGESGR